jgi:S1-C subfamily serine protease
VRDCARIRVVRDGVEHPAQVLAADAEADLAALVVSGPPLQALELATGDVELGEPILVLGYPLAAVLGPDLRVTAGIVSARSGLRGDPRSIQISAPVQRGNSGGPVLDANGAVAAVVTRKLDSRLGAENVTFAITARQVRQFLAGQQIETPPVRTRPVSTGAGAAGVVRRAAPAVYMVQCG